MYINGIFEGGGIKGIAYIGAIKFLEERGYRFKFVGGSSVGSLVASLLVARYTAADLEKFISEFDLSILLNSKSKKPIQMFINGIKYKGLYSMKYFEEYLYGLLKKNNCTQFRDVKMGDKYLLNVVATDLKNRKMVTIPTDLGFYNYSKDSFPIAKAVAMSCSIPVFFEPYRINGNIFVDGGIVNNFPINLFEDRTVPTLGIRLKEGKKTKKIITKYKNKIFNLSGEPKLDSYNIVDINVQGYKFIDFKKGLDNYKELIKLGYNSMKDYYYSKL